MCKKQVEVLHKKPFSGLILENNWAKNSPNVEKSFHKGLKKLSGSDPNPCQTDFKSCKDDAASCEKGRKVQYSFPAF